MVHLAKISLCITVLVQATIPCTRGFPMQIEGSPSPRVLDQKSPSSAEMRFATSRKPKASFDFKCGSRPLPIAARVVGGTPAREGEWPWHVILKEVKLFGIITSYKCGGTLISDRHVLTAAHCKPDTLYTGLTATLGQREINEEDVQTIPVRRMTIHENFDSSDFNNDLAVLELEYPVKLSPRIVPICLPDATDDFIGQVGRVSGWGKLSYGGRFPKGLQSVELPIIPREDCKQMFREKGHDRDIHDNFLCAGGKAGRFDACEGDSGGPLSVLRSNGQWVLAGTVSYGVKCAEPGLAGVYVNVPRYESWIHRAMNQKYSVTRPPALGPLAELMTFFNEGHPTVVYLS